MRSVVWRRCLRGRVDGLSFTGRWLCWASAIARSLRSKHHASKTHDDDQEDRVRTLSEDRVRTLYTLSAGEVCRFAELRPDFGRHWSRKMGRSGAGDRPRTRSQRRPTPQVVAAQGVFQQRLRLQEAREYLPMPAFAANEDYRRLSICPCLPSIASALQRNFCRTRSRRTIVAQ